MMCDFGFEVKLALVIDAKAIDVSHLCLQDEVKSKSLKVRRVKNEQHVA